MAAVIGLVIYLGTPSFLRSPETHPAAIKKAAPVVAPGSAAPASPAPVDAPSGRLPSQPDLKDIKDSSPLYKAIAYNDFISHLIAFTRPRLGSYTETELAGGIKKLNGYVQFFNQSNEIVEQFDFQQLQDFGWHFLKTSYGMLFRKGNLDFVVTRWPLPKSDHLPSADIPAIKPTLAFNR